MNQNIEQLVFQWRQTPRLRLGVFLIVVIVAGYILMLLNDFRDQGLRDMARQQSRLLKVQALSKQELWMARAKVARVFRIKNEALLWQAESKGLAQAKIQSWFTNKLPALGLKKLTLDTELAADVPGRNKLWQVSANLKGAVDRLELISLLKLLELNDKLITVEQLRLKRTRSGLRLSLQARAWFGGMAADGQ